MSYGLNGTSVISPSPRLKLKPRGAGAQFDQTGFQLLLADVAALYEMRLSDFLFNDRGAVIPGLHADDSDKLGGFDAADYTRRNIAEIVSGEWNFTGADIEFENRISVDTIDEFLAANGIRIDGLRVKDGTVIIDDGVDGMTMENGGIEWQRGTANSFFLASTGGDKELVLDIGASLAVDTLKLIASVGQLNITGPVVGTGDFTWDSPTFHIDSALNRVGLFATNPAFDFDIRKSTGNVTQRLRGTSAATCRMESSTFSSVWSMHLNGSPDTWSVREDASSAKERLRINPGGIVDILVSLSVDLIENLTGGDDLTLKSTENMDMTIDSNNNQIDREFNWLHNVGTQIMNLTEAGVLSVDTISALMAAQVTFQSPLNLQFDAGAGGSETEIIGYDFDGGVG